MTTAALVQNAMQSSTSFAPICRDLLACLSHESLPYTEGRASVA